MSHMPILVLDFDGVIHSYKSGWKGADVIPDPIVDGAVEFIMEAQANGWKVAVYSSRSNQPGGMAAMKQYMRDAFLDALGAADPRQWTAYEAIDWPTEKPPATITLDDRAVTFAGKWPSMDFLKNFKPWTKNTEVELEVSPEESVTISEVLRAIHNNLHLNKPIAIGVNAEGVLSLFKGTETTTEDIIGICQQLMLSAYTELNGGVMPKSITFMIGDPEEPYVPERGPVN